MDYPKQFQELEVLLVSEIPKALSELGCDTPMSMVRIYYYDTHAPCAYFTLRAISESLRSGIIERDGPKGLEFLWSPAEECGDHEMVLDDEIDSLRTPLASVYDLLCENEGEQKYMPALREMLQRVARTLSSADWSSTIAVTDDFVVTPADGSMYFDDDYHDISSSISNQLLETLCLRGFIGPSVSLDYSSEDELTHEYITGIVQSLQDAATVLPPSDRVQHWVTQLDKVLAKQPLADKRLDLGVNFVFEEGAVLGEEFVVAALKSTLKWCSQPEWIWLDGMEKDPEKTIAGQYVWEVFSEVSDLGHATEQIESLLLDCLYAACLVNKGKPLWGAVPMHCAECLTALFDKYPESDVDETTNALCNPCDYLPALFS